MLKTLLLTYFIGASSAHNFFEPGIIRFPLRSAQQSINYESFTSSQQNITIGRCEHVSDNRVVLNLQNLRLDTPPNPYPGFIDGSFVSCINLAANDIFQIVPGSFDQCPSLSYLDLSRNRIQFCDFFNFGSSHPSLVTLIIEDNKPPIDNIDRIISKADCFPRLRYLYLRRNAIRGLNFSLRRSFPIITHLFLSDNHIDTQTFIHDLPPTLTHLYLERNFISELNCHIMRNLENLHLDGNIIRSICYKSCHGSSLKLEGVHKLTTLTISDNRIIEIESCAFQDARDLMILNLGQNNLDDLKHDTFEGLLSLRELNLDDNHLKTVPNLSNNNKLVSLALRRNKLQMIRRDNFMNMRMLKYLYLGGNNIQSIIAGSFEHLESLMELDLSNNGLDFIPSDWLKWQWNLHTLDVRGNRFKSLEQMSLNTAPSLSIIYLQNNPITHFSGSIVSKFSPNAIIHLQNDCSDRIQNRTECYAKCDQNESRMKNETYIRWINKIKMSWLITSLVIFTGTVNARVQFTKSVQFPLRNIQNSINVESNYSYELYYKSEFRQYYNTNNGYILNLSKLSLPWTPNPYPGFIESSNIVTINLRENGIFRIIPGSFDSVPYMQFLDLSRNKLAFCDFFYFGSCVQNLQTLVIEENQSPTDSLNKEISRAGCFPNVQNLYIRQNSIRRLSFCLKQSFPNLVSLYLSDNEIDSCNFIRDVPTNLAHLYVDHNHISSISTFITRNLVTLKADGNIIRSICYKNCSNTSLKLLGTKRLQHLSVSSNKITQIEAYALHDSFNLVSLNLSSNSLETIYPSTFASLRSLTQLHLDNNLLTHVPNLSGNWYLKTLSLRKNRITEIKRDIFISIKSVQKIYLGSNSIKRIHSDAFSELTYLQELDLSNNQLETLSTGWMRNLINLQRLDLRNNRFTYVYHLSLSTSLTLRIIHLQRNRFAQSDKGEIQRYCPNAQIYIDDYHNNYYINDVVYEAKNNGSKNNKSDYVDYQNLAINENFPQLQYLSLRNVNINNFSINWIKHFPKLEYLDVSENLLADNLLNVFLKNTTSNIKSLIAEKIGLTMVRTEDLLAIEHLNLNHNHLPRFSSHKCHGSSICFEDMDNLKFLSLSNCSVTYIEDNAFKYMKNLLELDLSNNCFQKIPNQTFGYLYSLLSLNLSYNPLISMPNIEKLQSLTTLILDDYNPQRCLNNPYYTSNYECSDTYTLKVEHEYPQLTHLSIRKIFINLFDIDWKNNFPKLSYLDISYNSLSQAFDYLPQSLTSLTMRNVGMTSLGILKLENLIYLDLNENKFQILSSHLCYENYVLCLRNIINLQSLYIAQCSIEFIEADAFKYAEKLNQLDMSSNVFEEIPVETFELLPALSLLNLSRNNLKTIPNFSNLQNLTSLYMDSMVNKKLLSPDALENFPLLPTLKIISLRFNELKTIPLSFLNKLPNLLELDLSSNRIASLPSGQWNKNLQNLYLDNNIIKNLEDISLQEIESLKLLSIRANLLYYKINLIFLISSIHKRSKGNITKLGSLKEVIYSQ
ncbi:protein artichoke-like [Phymastichus coffea]|uniref:protein artichoke-like n=1 Tax=Phymastichus coffea TaxID=108790 RepID=UPI00273C2A9A|nr:protein artichoke-like [Phymastichus coffea]